jgi:transcriptional regulator with XRE-family HTH domain
VKKQSVNTPSLQQQFGALVRSLRLQRGLNQTDLAVTCGFYQTYLSRIEQGKANPTLNAIEVIANALGLTVFELFEKLKPPA